MAGARHAHTVGHTPPSLRLTLVMYVVRARTRTHSISPCFLLKCARTPPPPPAVFPLCVWTSAVSCVIQTVRMNG